MTDNSVQAVEVTASTPRLRSVSYSEVNTFKMCPQRYRFAYILRMPTVQKPYTLFGNFCHEILQDFHKEFKDSVPTVESMKNKMKDIFNDCTKREKYKSLTKDQKLEAYDIMKKYLKVSIDEVTNNKFPKIIDVEKKIWETVSNNFIFNGYIDRLQLDDDGVIHVIDYKTTKDKKYLKDRTQLMLYSYFVAINNKCDRVRTSYIMLKHNMQYLTTEYQMNELLDVKNKFEWQWNEIKNEKLFRPNARFDTCTICDYVNSCNEGAELMQRKKGFHGEEFSW